MNDRTRFTTMAEVMAAHEAAGGFWFSPRTMEYFQSRIESDLIAGRYFVTSEQESHPYGQEPRKFSVREVHPDDAASITTVGQFQEHATRDDAVLAIRTLELNQLTQRQDADGHAFLAYYRATETLAFSWSGDFEQPVEVAHGGAGEPVVATFHLRADQFPPALVALLSDFVALFGQHCDEWADDVWPVL